MFEVFQLWRIISEKYQMTSILEKSGERQEITLSDEMRQLLLGDSYKIPTKICCCCFSFVNVYLEQHNRNKKLDPTLANTWKYSEKYDLDKNIESLDPLENSTESVSWLVLS